MRRRAAAGQTAWTGYWLGMELRNLQCFFLGERRQWAGQRPRQHGLPGAWRANQHQIMAAAAAISSARLVGLDLRYRATVPGLGISETGGGLPHPVATRNKARPALSDDRRLLGWPQA